jgi:hypothetical protein
MLAEQAEHVTVQATGGGFARVFWQALEDSTITSTKQPNVINMTAAHHVVSLGRGKENISNMICLEFSEIATVT